MDSHFREPPLNRFRLAERESLLGGLEPWFPDGAAEPWLGWVGGILGWGARPAGLEDFTPSAAGFLLLGTP